MENPKIPLYCKICGNMLTPDVTITEYDEFTGKAIQPFLNQVRCPNHTTHQLDQLRKVWG